MDEFLSLDIISTAGSRKKLFKGARDRQKEGIKNHLEMFHSLFLSVDISE